MPGVCRLGWKKELVQEAREAWQAGVRHFVLFPRTDAALKTRHGEEARNPRGLVQRCVRELKEALPQSEVYTDVALDPYTSDGHDGIVDDSGRVANDATVEALIAQALSHAEAGADCVSPSDMMDGRIGAIRSALDKEGHQD
ncbi:delta-aminolevulinic acid dehydratase, partial [Helicosporidium sp. ATCC 50920]